MDVKHGDKVIGRLNSTISSGYFVGYVKFLDGSERAILQPRADTIQFYMVDWKTLRPYDGAVILRDRSNEPAERVLPPLASSKF
jgi:hypothetical protein